MFHQFLNQLADFPSRPNVTNPYWGRSKTAVTRTHNLHRYLQKMHTSQPIYLLVGEALGYRGGRLTGIPFTSPHLLLSHSFFGERNGYQRPSEWPHIQKEMTATMMWAVLANLPCLPLLWNAFPYHPHQTGMPQSNRPPTKTEMAGGRPFLQQLHALFPIRTIIAVGRKADMALNDWQYPHHTIRHPSHGGKQEFEVGIKMLILPS